MVVGNLLYQIFSLLIFTSAMFFHLLCWQDKELDRSMVKNGYMVDTHDYNRIKIQNIDRANFQNLLDRFKT